MVVGAGIGEVALITGITAGVVSGYGTGGLIGRIKGYLNGKKAGKDSIRKQVTNATIQGIQNSSPTSRSHALAANPQAIKAMGS